MRADARQNEARLLAAAAEAFATQGAGASLKDIAGRAGVGIGTLYRRFPTREHLVEAVYRNESALLCARADGLLAERPPVEALRAWMDGFVDYIATKDAMADALHAVLASDGELRTGTRDLLAAAVRTLMRAGVADGSLRDDVAPYDVMLGLGGVTLIAAHESRRDLADRLLDLMIEGLRARPAP